jgi:hypothetical protein
MDMRHAPCRLRARSAARPAGDGRAAADGDRCVCVTVRILLYTCDCRLQSRETRERSSAQGAVSESAPVTASRSPRRLHTVCVFATRTLLQSTQ